MPRRDSFTAKVSDIAKEAQVADGTIYLYFDNKDDILISLFEEQMKTVLENMIEEMAEEKDAVQEDREVRPHPPEAHRAEQERGRDHPGGAAAEQQVHEGVQERKIPAVPQPDRGRDHGGPEAGLFRKDIIPDIAKRAFFGALDEMSRFWVLSSHRKYDIETAAKQISGYFLYGLTQDPAHLSAE